MSGFKDFLAEGPRIKRIRIRIRGGKVQRNVRVSGVKGFRVSKGRLVRMSAQERMHRKRGARKAKVKRRSHKARTLMKRQRSLRRRHAMGM